MAGFSEGRCIPLVERGVKSTPENSSVQGGGRSLWRESTKRRFIMDKKVLTYVEKPVTRRTFLKKGAAVAAGAALSPLIRISPAGAASEIRIGCITGVTGFAGPWSRSMLQAANQIIDETNAAGGIKSMKGAKLRLLVADSKSDLKIQASETEKMINVNKIKLFFGASGSALDMVGSAITDKYGCITISICTADPLTERGLKYYFRQGVKASDNAKCAVSFAWHMYQDMGKKFKKVGVLHSDDAWGTSAGKGMEVEIAKHPEWDYAGRIAYPPAKLIDATDYINRAKGQGIEVLFQSSTPESGIIIQQAVKAVDYNPQANVHAHGAPYKKEYADSLGKDAEYVYCATMFVADMLKKYPKNVQDYCARYKTRYKGEDMDDNSASASSTMGTLIDAIERAGSDDPDKVREALLKTDLGVGSTPYIATTDGVKFDEAHHNIKAKTNMHQIRGGLLRCVWPETFRTEEPVWPVLHWRDRA